MHRDESYSPMSSLSEDEEELRKSRSQMSDSKRMANKKKKRRAKLAKVAGQALREIWQMDGDGIFHLPVDDKVAPQYYEIIKHPMDFTTIQKKIKKGAYGSFHGFELDLQRIVSNAKTYNEAGSFYHKAALRLEARMGPILIMAHARLAAPHGAALVRGLAQARARVEARCGALSPKDEARLNALLAEESKFLRGIRRDVITVAPRLADLGVDPDDPALEPSSHLLAGGVGKGDPRYLGPVDRVEKPPRCAFCRKEEVTSVTGPFLDPPFSTKTKAAYSHVHAFCALFGAPEVVYDAATDAWNNVIDAMNRGRFIKCASDACGKARGATLGCKNSSCNKSYHLPCTGIPVEFFINGGSFYCPNHRDSDEAKADNANISSSEITNLEGKARADAAAASGKSTGPSDALTSSQPQAGGGAAAAAAAAGNTAAHKALAALVAQIEDATRVHAPFATDNVRKATNKAGQLTHPVALLSDEDYREIVGKRAGKDKKLHWFPEMDVRKFSGNSFSAVDARNILGGSLKFNNRTNPASHTKRLNAMPDDAYRPTYKKTRTSKSKRSSSSRRRGASRSSKRGGSALTEEEREDKNLALLLKKTDPANPTSAAALQAGTSASSKGLVRLPVIEPEDIKPRRGDHFMVMDKGETPPVATLELPVSFRIPVNSLGPTHDSSFASLSVHDSSSFFVPSPGSSQALSANPGPILALEAKLAGKKRAAQDPPLDDTPSKRTKPLSAAAALDSIASLAAAGFDTSFIDEIRANQANTNLAVGADGTPGSVAKTLAQSSAYLLYMASMPFIRDSSIPTPWELEAASRFLANNAALARALPPSAYVPQPRDRPTQ